MGLWVYEPLVVTLVVFMIPCWCASGSDSGGVHAKIVRLFMHLLQVYRLGRGDGVLYPEYRVGER